MFQIAALTGRGRLATLGGGALRRACPTLMRTYCAESGRAVEGHLGTAARRDTPEGAGPCSSGVKDVAGHASEGTAGGSKQLTHVDARGRAVMVDVGGKPDSQRSASAQAVVRLGGRAFCLLRDNRLRKGEALVVAQLAGIGGAKLTAQLIPLCHAVQLHYIDVSLELDEARLAAVVTATCSAAGKTGVEMEALVAASVAALTVYDMCKAVTHDIVIEEVKLLSKTGGQRGDFHRFDSSSLTTH